MKHGIGACALALAGVCAWAATTTAWEMSTYQDLVRGRFDGVALDRDGRLTLAPKLSTVLASGQSIVWSLAQTPGGVIYAGTGHRGRVYRIEPNGTKTVVWTADQPEIFAVAAGPHGDVYAATSPDGKVYRLHNGAATEVYAPKAKYIWSLAVASDGALYIGTGMPGNIYRVAPGGTGELWYQTGQSHVMSLAVDSQARVLAGTEPNGILYRVSGKGQAFVLYDANLPEIHSVRALPDGTVYAAALGGAVTNRALHGLPVSVGSSAITVTAPATSITVTDSADAQTGPEVKAPTATPKTATPVTQSAITVAGSIEVPGLEKSAIYRVNPDNTVETMWSSKDENIYDFTLRADGSITAATDLQGRIYRIGHDRKASLIAETNQGEATRLLPAAAGLLVGTGDTGEILRLDSIANTTGSYESPVHDANTVARWGRLSWHGAAGSASFQTRTGNSLRPDQTWSAWSAAITDPQRAEVKSPNARYIQWRVQLMGANAEIDDVTIAYVPQNTPPVVRSISVTPQSSTGATQKTTASTSTSSTAAYTVTVTDTAGGETASSSSGTPAQTVSRTQGAQLLISWQADDPDGDHLTYALYFRGEGETQWKLLKTNLTDNSYTIDGDSLADGRYYFRVIASDRLSNPPQYARQSDLVSSPVVIDNTPPLVTLTAPRRNGAQVEMEASATDAASALRRCEYSIDAGPWTPVEAADGVTDAPQETFHIAVNLRPGEHLIVVRVFDAANNAGLAKAVVH